MKRLPLMLALVAGGLMSGTALAAGWADFENTFPVFPCQDGWSACLVGGSHVTPDLRDGDGGMKRGAAHRLDWSSLDATDAFSPFVTLSEYTGDAVAEAEPEVPDEPEDIEPPPSPVASSGSDNSGSSGSDNSGSSGSDNSGSSGSSGGNTDYVEPEDTTPPPSNSGGSMVRPKTDPTTPPAGNGGSMVRPSNLNGGSTPPPEDAPPEEAPPEEAAPPVADAIPPKPPAEPEGCENLTMLEPAAMLGRLTDGQVACLEASLAAADSQTGKDKLSRVLMANAWSKGDKKTWEKLVKRHLDEIDQSDPDICYKYAMYLSKKGVGRSQGVIRWADVALENKTRWSGSTYTSRVYNLYKLRAAASQQLWQASEQKHASSPTDQTKDAVEKSRNQTKVYSREWFEYAKEAGKDTTKALQLCISAAGTKDYCEGL